MRRIDAIGVGLAVLILGGGLFVGFRAFGFDSAKAGIWSQAVFISLLIVWVLSYVFRAGTGNMTLNQQLDDYEDAVLQKRLDEMTPEQLAELQAKLNDGASQEDT
ncbi:MAG: DUF3007 family protein [Cyanobacteria bacterium P01_F01_bin.150]